MDDKELMMKWWRTDEELMKTWWKTDEELMKSWWRVDKLLMKNGWRIDEELMKTWLKTDEELMKNWSGLPKTTTDYHRLQLTDWFCSSEHSKLSPGLDGWIHLSLTPPTTRAPLAVLIKSTPFWEESESGVLASDGFIIWIFPLGESKLPQTSVKEAFENIVLFWLPAFDGLMIYECWMFTVWMQNVSNCNLFKAAYGANTSLCNKQHFRMHFPFHEEVWAVCSGVSEYKI